MEKVKVEFEFVSSTSMKFSRDCVFAFDELVDECKKLLKRVYGISDDECDIEEYDEAGLSYITFCVNNWNHFIKVNITKVGQNG